MKKIILLLSVVLVVACSTDPKDLAKKNFEEKIKSSLNDPDSYEFVEMSEFKEIKGGPLFRWKNSELDLAKFGQEDTTDIIEMRKELDIYKNNPDQVFRYISDIKIRANNALGAKVLNTYEVTFDTDYKVITIEN